MPPTTPSTPVLAVIGAGRLGRTLARLWFERGVFRIGDVVTRSRASAETATRFIGAGRPRTPDDGLARTGLVMVAVADDALDGTAAWLASREAIEPGAILFHCSGARTASALEPLRSQGALLASVHPMHSFADPARSLVGFAGTACALEGDATALDLLAPAFASIGGRPLRIRGDAKLLYHAAGVFASNYVTVLVDTALRLLDTAGIAEGEARELLAPLLSGAIDSALALGPGAALTGPVARGDAALVARQADAVTAHAAGDGASYRALGQAALALAAGSGRLDDDSVRALRRALDSSGQPSDLYAPPAQSIKSKP